MEHSVKQLFLKYFRNQASAQEIEQVLALIQGDEYPEELKAAMLEFQDAFNADDENVDFPQQNQLYGKIKIRTFPQQRSRVQWMAYAAAALLVCTVSWWWLQSEPASPQANLEHVVTAGKSKPSARQWLKLSDGTSVHLNVNSHLDYPDNFDGKGLREVTLVGEAFFDVAHDSKHPFIIHTGKRNTTVLGTAFNISAYDNKKSVTVTVTRGKVSVQRANQTLAILTPDQQLIWHANQQSPRKTLVNAQHAIAWQSQDLIMDDITLLKAADMIAERFKVKVVFKTDQVKDCRFTAAFLNRNDLEQVTQVLSSITGAIFQRNGNQLLISGEGCAD